MGYVNVVIYKTWITISINWLICSCEARQLYLLSNRESGLNIRESKEHSTDYTASLAAVEPIGNEDLTNIHLLQDSITQDWCYSQHRRTQPLKKEYLRTLPENKNHVVDLASEKAASSWLTAFHRKRTVTS